MKLLIFIIARIYTHVCINCQFIFINYINVYQLYYDKNIKI